jgi:cell division protein FtsB
MSKNNNFYQNKEFNHPLSVNKNKQNNNNNINIKESSNNSKQLNKMSEEEKREIEAESDIRNKLKCYICKSKVIKPKMCKYCKKLSCSYCISKWLLQHDFCGFCKKNITTDDVILIPFIDDMSTYFIKNIENNPVYKSEKIEKPKNKIKSEKLDNKEEVNDKSNICKKHNNKFQYYCIQCDNCYCNNCLDFFGEETKKHLSHFIFQVEKMKEIASKFKSEDNKKYINQIEDLKQQLLEEKDNYNKLKTENTRLEKMINSLKQQNNDINTKLEKEINKLKANMRQLENELERKNNTIQDYILEINSLKENKNQITSIKPGEKIFSVLFMTQGNQDIFNYAMTCKNTELFVRLEERLYDDFPQFKKVETIFMVDARRILRFQTLDENNIKRNDIISLFVADQE